MCNFFSFVTDPVNHPLEYYFLDWEYRKENLKWDDADSHSHICKEFNLREDVCNKYEFNPLTKAFKIDQINSEKDDSEAAKKWANRLDFKTVVEPLIVKPIINPLLLPKVEKPTDEQIGWLKELVSVLAPVWGAVGYSVRDSVWNSVGDSVLDSIWDAVWSPVRDAVRVSVWESIWSSNRVYFSSFFNIEYKFDYSSAIKLWEAGLVPSFDGGTWRLHSGKNADVVYEWTPEATDADN